MICFPIISFSAGTFFHLNNKYVKVATIIQQKRKRKKAKKKRNKTNSKDENNVKLKEKREEKNPLKNC